MINFLPNRFLRGQPLGPAGNDRGANPGVRLTGTQAKLQDALLAALHGTSPSVVLTGAAGVGKTTVLTAALSCINEPERQVLWLDDAKGGIEAAFPLLFAPGKGLHRRQHAKRCLALVVDQVEARPPGDFALLELLSRMPGKTAPVQWIVVGRSEPWAGPHGPAASWLRETGPTCLTLLALSEQDAWELFFRRVSPTRGPRSVAKLVTNLLSQSEGLPGRFDAAVRAAIAAGLLQGIPTQAA